MVDQKGRVRLPAASRRAQIMKVAAEMFSAGSYDETSMEAIAKQVGIRKASLYYYFTSKDDLLAQMHQESFEPIIFAHQQRVSSGEFGPPDLLLAMMTDLISLLETHAGDMHMVFDHYGDLPETARAKITEQGARYHQLLVDVLDRGVADGQFTVAEPNLTALAILGMCSSTHHWFRPGLGLTA
ncbi:MAG TPA: TetR/AcrR family transcriptional regulator, partial [Trebonia sp.]|nr:TetR/AcrR family transcriptional regulator [Trebonia sp.]